MAYMRMVNWLLPEHGLALSDRDETGVAYWNDGVMAWNEQHGLALSELPRAARDANGNAFDVRPTAKGNAFDMRPTAVSAVPRKWPQPEWPPPPEGGTVWSEDEDTELRRRLAAFQADGWRQVDVVGDGNCFFRALAKQVNGDEQLHGRARQETIRYMRERREEFEHLIEDFDSYVDHMSREGTFVEGELEIRAAANTFNVCIEVIGRSRNHDKTFAPLERDSETRDVYMAHYQAAQHYVVLERMDPASTARGGLPDPCRRAGAVSPERPSLLPSRTLAESEMFMRDEWSDDEFDDDTEAVVPISMIPTPQVISGGSSSGAADTQYRAATYNERMARARQASKKTGSAGAMCDYARPSWLELLSASYA